jgi:hypothetical protein
VVHNNTANIIWWNHYKKCFFIGKLDIFPLMYAIDKIWITELTLIHKNIRSVLNSSAQVYWSIWCKTHYDITDKNNNVSSEGLDRHHHIYPSSYYRTRWDICDKVCLDFYVGLVTKAAMFLMNCGINHLTKYHTEKQSIKFEIIDQWKCFFCVWL